MSYEFPTKIEDRAASLLSIDVGERANDTVKQLHAAGLSARVGLT